MNTIHLQQVLPQVFADRDNLTSDVWHQDIIFEKGKYYLIEAASGTGKSSLCSYLYGYRDDYQGIICFDGQNTRSLRRPAWTRLRRHSLSLLFQELRLFPELTALENVLLKNRLGKLSFGQQQRVAFIRSLCQPMDFILLDEPISHLDETNAAVMAQLLAEEAGRQGTGILVTSIGKHLEIDYHSILKL